jgi:hypothetical protein
MSDEAIRKAMEEGAFEGLAGKGKPLKLEDNPFEDPSWRMAHHLLQANDFTLPWIDARNEIEADLDAARQRLGRAWHAARRAPQAWQRAQQAFRQQVEALNRRIRDYNLAVPNEQLHRLPLNAEREIQVVTQSPPG